MRDLKLGLALPLYEDIQTGRGHRGVLAGKAAMQPSRAHPAHRDGSQTRTFVTRRARPTRPRRAGAVVDAPGESRQLGSYASVSAIRIRLLIRPLDS